MCLLYTNILHPPPFLAHLLFNLGLTLTAYQIQHFTAFFFFLFLLTLLSEGNIIPIFIPLWMQVSLWICSLHAQSCLLPPEVKRPRNCPYLLCMCSISIDSPFPVKSAVNTRRVAQLVLFMNMCPWRHPLSSLFTKPQCRKLVGECYTESQTVFTVSPDLSTFLYTGRRGIVDYTPAIP